VIATHRNEAPSEVIAGLVVSGERGAEGVSPILPGNEPMPEQLSRVVGGAAPDAAFLQRYEGRDLVSLHLQGARSSTIASATGASRGVTLHEKVPKKAWDLGDQM